MRAVERWLHRYPYTSTIPAAAAFGALAGWAASGHYADPARIGGALAFGFLLGAGWIARWSK